MAIADIDKLAPGRGYSQLGSSQPSGCRQPGRSALQLKRKEKRFGGESGCRKALTHRAATARERHDPAPRQFRSHEKVFRRLTKPLTTAHDTRRGTIPPRHLALHERGILGAPSSAMSEVKQASSGYPALLADGGFQSFLWTQF